MGKAGRFACIFLPMALTIASLITFGMVIAGQAYKNIELSRDLYFFKADTSKFNADPDNVLDHLPDNVNIDNNLLQALQGAASSKELKDFYQIGLWNYCEGDKDDKGKETITYCSPRKSNFWFNPFEVWELKGTSAQKVLGDDLKKGLDVYQKATKWMFAAFIITICLTAAEFLVGIFAIFSRWGSLVTTIVSTAQTIFAIAAASSATAIYLTLVGVFESVLKPYDIKTNMGKQMLAVMWLAVAFSVASGFFWLISICCCSGKSPHKKVQVEKTPYTYERVASPAFGGQQHGTSSGPAFAGHGTSGTAYEPFRQQHV